MNAISNSVLAPEFLVRLPRELSATLGQSAILECQIDGHPFPDIMWTKDDDEITDSDDPKFVDKVPIFFLF